MALMVHSRMPTCRCTIPSVGEVSSRSSLDHTYGETNEDFQEVLKVCARMAVARDDAVYNSPILETEVKGGAYGTCTVRPHL